MKITPPKSLVKLYVAITTFLSFLGLSSITDDFFVWVGFFGRVVDVYQSLIRDNLIVLYTSTFGQFIPIPSPWVFDVGLIWGLSYSIFRAFIEFENEHTFLLFYLKGKWYLHPLMLILGPFNLIFLGLWSRARINYEIRTANEERDGKFGQLSEAGHWAIEARLSAAEAGRIVTRKVYRKLVWSYITIIFVLIILLFINYQISLFQL